MKQNVDVNLPEAVYIMWQFGSEPISPEHKFSVNWPQSIYHCVRNSEYVHDIKNNAEQN